MKATTSSCADATARGWWGRGTGDERTSLRRDQSTGASHAALVQSMSCAATTLAVHGGVLTTSKPARAPNRRVSSCRGGD
jgi:hypothetical protein